MCDFMLCELYLDKALFKKKDYEFTQIHSFLSKTNPLDGLNGKTCKRTGK